MQHVDPRHLGLPQHEDAELRQFISALTKCAPYLFRVARAGAYGMAAYLLLWLQPHFSFSFAALALAVFFLALVRRTMFLAEAALGLIVVSVFVPVGFPGLISGLF